MKVIKVKWPCVVLCIVLINSSIVAERVNKAIKPVVNLTLVKADIAYQDGGFAIAANYYVNYLKNNMDPQNAVGLKLADCYWQMWDNKKAFQVYKSMYPNKDSNASKKIKNRIAELYVRNNQYKEASEWLQGIDSLSYKAAMYSDVRLINSLKKDSLNWTVRLSIINSDYRDFSPVLTNNVLVFSSNKPSSPKSKGFAWDGNSFSHLWQVPIAAIQAVQGDKTTHVATKNNKITSGRRLAGVYECGSNTPSVNAIRALTRQEFIFSKSTHIGTLVKGLERLKFNVSSMSIDKYNHAYFSSNYNEPDRKGVNRICIMEGDYSASGIKNINKMPLGDINSYSVMHPTINWEGTLLVFSSDMPNGKGGYDLYYISRTDSLHMWSPIKMFDKNVNTMGAEVFPTITRDGYLYFSSDAQQGLGGLDIYKIRLSDAIKGTGQVEHISYPINSSADDLGWTQDSIGTMGFFTSDRYNDNDNIYHFNYSPPKRILEYTIGGYVKEKESFMPLEGSKVFMYNIDDNSVSVAKTGKDGKYQFSVHPNSKVIIKAVDKSHTSDCLYEIIDVEKQIKDTTLKVSRNLMLCKLSVGAVWKLNNIRYDFDKSNIRSDATPSLDSLVAFLKMYPINVELGSHTDSRGSFAYNERLSQQRANSAVAYIVRKGISPSRISAKGYGESRLLNKCADGVKCDEAEHQVNRRTEVKITSLATSQKIHDSVDADKFEFGKKVDRSMLPNGFFDECDDSVNYQPTQSQKTQNKK